jgi:ferredoxin
MTCAGPCYINYIAPMGLKRILRKRGFKIVYEKVFGMPANVLIHFNDEISKQMWNAAARKAAVMAEDLLAGRESVRKDGIFAAILRGNYAWAERFMLPLLALDYKVSGSCVKCMKCVENCLKCNIAFQNGRIRFRTHCAGCYRCVYGCPEKAIKGRLFGIMILKNGYDIQRIIRDDTLKGDAIHKHTKGVFKTLYKYLSE